MTRIDIPARDLRINSTPITPSDLLPELAWVAPAGTDLSGYLMEHYFDLDIHEVYDCRAHAVQAMRDSYKGTDVDGVGLDLKDLG